MRNDLKEIVSDMQRWLDAGREWGGDPETVRRLAVFVNRLQNVAGSDPTETTTVVPRRPK